MAAAGEGRRRGTARGSRSVAATAAGSGAAAAAGSGAAAAAQILQQPHTTPHRLGRSTRRSRTSDGIGRATHRTHARPSNNNVNHHSVSAVGVGLRRGACGGNVVATNNGTMPALSEGDKQASESSFVNTTNGNNISGSTSGTERVAAYARDTDCSCSSCTLRSNGSAEIKKWQFSDAKAHLRGLLSNDKQHSYWQDPPSKVYDDNRELFHLYKYENFYNNVRSLKKAIRSEQDGVDFDEAAIERESSALPRAPLTSQDNPFYDTSQTKKILVELAKEGKLEQYKYRPSALKETNPVFDEYKSNVFAKAVNREKRRVNEVAGWQLKRNIQGSKKNNAKYEKV